MTADWTTGAVGMTGGSYNGTLPNMVATTGVEGLKTIVPVAAISSWYDYYRANGLVVAPGGYQGEDADILAMYTAGRSRAEGTCADEIAEITDDRTGSPGTTPGSGGTVTTVRGAPGPGQRPRRPRAERLERQDRDSSPTGGTQLARYAACRAASGCTRAGTAARGTTPR